MKSTIGEVNELSDIVMHRGDKVDKKFRVINKVTKEPMDIAFDDIFITFKMVYLSETVTFQKRMSNGDIVFHDGYYHFSIMPEDTDNLPFGKYDYDIEVVRNGQIKQTRAGKLYITNEVTYASNEE